MADLSVVGSFYAGVGIRYFSGITDFAFYEADGQLFLFVASEGTNDLQMYYVYGDAVMKYRDTEDFDRSQGTISVSEIEVVEIGGDYYVLTTGRYDDVAELVPITGSIPRIIPGVSVTGDAADYANLGKTHVVTIGAYTYVLASKRGDNHLYSYQIQDDGQFIAKALIQDDETVALGDITDFATIDINGTTFVAVTSAFDGGVTIYKLGAHGNLHHRDTVLASDGGGFSLPQNVEFIQSGGNTYLAMIAAGSSSISIYRVGNHGNLHQTDHVIDSLDTRFEGASQMAAITHEGRSFLFVAGNDDGLTVFELLPDGTLLHALTIADDFEVALTNVSALSVVIIDGEIHVFVAGAEDGMTQFIFDPDVLGGTFVGTTGKDVINGTARDDFLFGGRRGDVIDGGRGEDRIDGGGGKDYLTGGNGADTFVFTADGRKDFIMDFQDGLDLIDLSGYHQVNTIDDLIIKTREWGVMIEIRGEKLKIIGHGGDTITAEDFTADDFIF